MCGSKVLTRLIVEKGRGRGDWKPETLHQTSSERAEIMQDDTILLSIIITIVVADVNVANVVVVVIVVVIVSIISNAVTAIMVVVIMTIAVLAIVVVFNKRDA